MLRKSGKYHSTSVCQQNVYSLMCRVSFILKSIEHFLHVYNTHINVTLTPSVINWMDVSLTLDAGYILHDYTVFCAVRTREPLYTQEPELSIKCKLYMITRLLLENFSFVHMSLYVCRKNCPHIHCNNHVRV